MTKTAVLIINLMLLVKVVAAEEPLHWEDYKFVYDEPVIASHTGTWWSRASIIGNGHLGARIAGWPGDEHISLNLVSYWAGKPYNNFCPGAKDALPLIRKAIAARDYVKADQLAQENWTGPKAEPSLGVGWLDLDMQHGETFSDYRRVFDLDRAVVETTYKVDGVTFTKTAFCSHPDKVLAIRIATSARDAVSFSAFLRGYSKQETVTVEGRDQLVFQGCAGKDGTGMRVQCRLRIIATGGTVDVGESNELTVTGAESAVLLVTGQTSFNGRFKDPNTEGKDEKAAAKAMMHAASKKTWDQLLTAHIADHQALFRRFYIELGGRHKAGVNARQRSFVESQPHALIMQFGRYLMIAASREDSPAQMSLAGFWGCARVGAWQNAYHLNENTEKHYHFVEATGIPETAEPLYRFLKALSVRGAEIAKSYYGAEGWCAHHQSDIWAATGFRGNNPSAAHWPFGGAFLTQVLWRHYQFSGDEEFLREYYPVLKGNAEFILCWLIPGPDGKLITSPSSSPENHFYAVEGGEKAHLSYATTCDMTLSRQGLKECLWAAEILGVDEPLRKKIEKTLPRMYPYPIGSEGQLLEWAEEFHPLQSDHRHASGLLGLWSGSEITMQHTPELFKAAQIALQFKGDENRHPGTAIMWARARDGDRALRISKGTTFPQRWQPTRVCGAIAEMLLQSHAGELDILPALPKAWRDGRMYGIRARGGFTLDIAWNDGKATDVRIQSQLGGTAKVRCPGVQSEVISGGKTIQAERISDEVISFETRKGRTYMLVLPTDRSQTARTR